MKKVIETNVFFVEDGMVYLFTQIIPIPPLMGLFWFDFYRIFFVRHRHA
jgi:hypothetical protein